MKQHVHPATHRPRPRVLCIFLCILALLCIQASCLADALPGVICWGDSLTQGAGGGDINYPLVLKNLIRENQGIDVPVINMGVGGETTYTILGRSGVVPFVTNAEFTIPADTSPVPITFESSSGMSVSPLRQGKAGMETVSISGIPGVIRVKQSSPYEGPFSYTFTRSASGESKTVPVRTEIITSGSQEYLDYIPVVFIGQNGSYTSTEDLIAQQRALINHHAEANGRFIVIGLASGTEENRAWFEAALEAEYGRNYINLRKYMVEQGLADAGIEPTEADLERMSVGSTPVSLHISSEDTIHFNATGYTLIGRLVYSRMEELEYFG